MAPGMARLSPAATLALCGLWALQGAHASSWGDFWGVPSSKKHAVDELTGESFGQFIQEHPISLVLFYAPWCHFSQMMMPAWDTTAQKLDIHDPPIRVAKIDTSRYNSVGDEYGVSAFPSIKLIVDGSTFDYPPGSARTWQAMVKWVNMHLERDHILKGEEDLDNYLHDNSLNVVGLFPDGHNYTAFRKASRHFEDTMFAEAQGTELSQKLTDHIARHASLTCETVEVGTSERNAKSVPLPRSGMHCGNSPKNPQRPDWTDAFTTVVETDKLMVRRTDSSDGWEQHLQLRCCDEDKGQPPRFKITVPMIVMFMPHDERFAIYDGDLEDTDALTKWVGARRNPMIMHLTPDTAEQIMVSGPQKEPVMFLISKEPAEELEREVRKAAATLRGRVIICFSGVSTQIERRLADMAGVEEDSPPVLTLLDLASAGGGFQIASKYRLETKGLQASSVIKFVDDFHKKALKPWRKSEAEPQGEDPGPVGVLVGTTFSQQAFDESKDVLVDFYAPWCGHCRKFEPNYKQLAKRLRHVPTLRIMKLDATRNEVEGLSITGFPTVILFPAGPSPKKQIHYRGNRQPSDMVQWLHEHCATKFDDKPPPTAIKDDGKESGLLDPNEEDL